VATGTWLERRAGELGLPCRLVGHVAFSELLDLYAEARVVVVPSRFENFSVAGLEGMAAARPVVATSTNGMAYLIERSSGGTIVPPDDPQALAAAIAPYLADPGHAAATGARGRTEVASLNARVIARRREEAYRRAIDAHRRRRRKHVSARG
jgi:glycosyltransferase involved in cell wall biosynthesis